MKISVFSLVIVSLLILSDVAEAQETSGATTRTPEQEATIQTERMQKELNLTAEQTQSVYEINLRHARERKISNSRSQALERIKNKDEEIRQVLSREQYSRLQEMRYDRSTVTIPGSNREISTQLRTRPVNPNIDNQAGTQERPVRTNPQSGTRAASTPRYVSPVNPAAGQNAESRQSPGRTVAPSIRYSTPQSDNNTRYSVPQSSGRSGSTPEIPREQSVQPRSNPSSAAPTVRQPQPSSSSGRSSSSSSQPSSPPSRSSGSSSSSSSQRR